MSFAKIYSAQTIFLDSQIITVEVDISRGLHSFSIVGLPDKALAEAKDRVSAALKNSGFDSPKSKNHKVVFSLAPANIRKEGPGLDVALALGYLQATNAINFNPEQKLFLGELALDGTIRPVTGVLAVAQAAAGAGFLELYVPTTNAPEAALITQLTIYPIQSLREVIAHITGEALIATHPHTIIPAQHEQENTALRAEADLDFADIIGQETAKRALEIAAAGGHSIALFGPPGTGKTLLAKAFHTILPPLTFEQIIETTNIHSVAGILKDAYIQTPPFRAPHHSTSHTAVIGGNTVPRPGEITLAHNGVLFLDEFTEFDRSIIEALREPLEEHAITITRLRGSITFPADFILVAALNPCPCGYWGAKRSDAATKICTCSPTMLKNYQQKISGPIADRIDLWVEVGQINQNELATASLKKHSSNQSSKNIADRVSKARAKQQKRYTTANLSIVKNTELTAAHLKTIVHIDSAAQKTLTEAAVNLRLSARGYHRLMKVAQTIADLDETSGDEPHKTISASNILEALQYRKRE